MTFLEGIIREEVNFGFIRCAQIELHRTLKAISFAALYGNAAASEVERDFMVMYLMGGEL